MSRILILYCFLILGVYAEDSSEYTMYRQLAIDIHEKDMDKSLYYIDKAIDATPSYVEIYAIRGTIYSYWGKKLSNKDFSAQAWSDYTYFIDSVSGTKDQEVKETLSSVYILRGILSIDGELIEQGLSDIKMACNLNQSKCELFEKFQRFLK